MKDKRFHLREWHIAIAFLFPSLLGFLLFYIMPFLQSIWYSMIDNVLNKKFVGLANYAALLKSSSFITGCGNTLRFTAIFIPVNLLLSFLIASALNKTRYCADMLKMSFIAPLVIPVASVVAFWSLFFDSRGVLNQIMGYFRWETVDWMNSDKAIYCVILLCIWKNTGYSMIMFLAGLQNIPAQYYEAAEIEGADSWDRFRHITAVYLSPTTFFIIIVSIINSFKIFREIYLLAGSYPNRSIYTIQHYMNNMFHSLDYQKLTSASFLTVLVIYLFVVILYSAERKVGRYIS